MLNLAFREKVLIAFALVLTAIAVFAPPVTEPPGYFHFADQREMRGLPRAMDVLSNLPFFLVGLYGLRVLTNTHKSAALFKPFAAVFFAGLVVTSIGSAYFHLLPLEAGRLAVDRVGMLIAFAGLIGLASALKVSLRAGAAMAIFVSVTGTASIYIANSNANALPWALVQFGGLAFIIGFASLSAPKYDPKHQPSLGLWWIVVVYAAAKAFEMADQPVFDWTQHLVSGHSLKHIVASLAAWPVIMYFKRTQ
jgi:hypothetical protein